MTNAPLDEISIYDANFIDVMSSWHIFEFVVYAFQMLVPDETTEKQAFTYDTNSALIFIGGMPRSGTNLAGVMLDAHPLISCEKETRILPRILRMSEQISLVYENDREANAGMDSKTLDAAIANFILNLIVRRGNSTPRLCIEYPFITTEMVYLSKIFPDSKFIFMVRDARATVHSIISKRLFFENFTSDDYRKGMIQWNEAVQQMYLQCEKIGSDRCLRVYYEKLVLDPRGQMERILNFSDISWSENVLQHERFMEKSPEISLLKYETFLDQLTKPINLDSLTTWVGHIPADVMKDITQLAPMLEILGYDTSLYSPLNYAF